MEIAAKVKSYSGKPEFAEEAKKILIDNSGKGVVLITHCKDMRAARLAEELRAYCEFSLIIVGNPEENVRRYIEKLSGVRFAFTMDSSVCCRSLRFMGALFCTV